MGDELEELEKDVVLIGFFALLAADVVIVAALIIRAVV